MDEAVGRDLLNRSYFVFLVCSLLVWFPNTSRSQPGGPPLFTVKVRNAEVRDIAPSLDFTGSLEPWRIIELSTEVAGLVSSIPIEEGQPLHKGEVVCELDKKRIRIEIRRRQALVKNAEAEFRKFKNGYRQEEIEEARKNVAASRARFDRAKDDWNRQRPLVETGVVTQSEGRRYETAYLEAMADLQSAQSRLDLLLAGYREEEIDAAKANWEKALADLADASRELELHTVRAPLDCVVSERLKEPGEWVREGDAVAQVLVLDPLRIRFEVPQIYLSKVKPGLKASIEVDGLPGKTFSAAVDQIVPQAGMATRNFPVIMHLSNSDGLLPSGLFARIRLELDKPRPTICVPREAVMIRGDSLVVLVADPLPERERKNSASQNSQGSDGAQKENLGRQPEPVPDAVIREVEVRTGTEADGFVEVEVVKGMPIREGDRVVVLGGTRLMTGMPVKILPPSPSLAPQETQDEPPRASAPGGAVP